MMKKLILIGLIIFLTIPLFSFSRDTLKNDTTFQVTIAQIRAANRIFISYDFALKEISLLNDKIDLLNLMQQTNGAIIDSQNRQIETLNLTIAKKDEINSINQSIKQQYKEAIDLQRKQRWKYIAYGGVAGAAITVVLMSVF